MQLIKWDKLKYQIETAKDIETLTSLKNKLRAYQILAEQSKQSVEVQAKIAIYKARADRKCGEWLKENIREPGNPLWLQGETIGLKNVGINKTESHRLQKIAAIPAQKFEDILQECEIEVKKITSNMLVNIAKEAEKEERKIETPPLPKGKYQVIYADPPWDYPLAKSRKRVDEHYPTLDLEELKNLKDETGRHVSEIAADNCTLFLWATSGRLNWAFPVLEAWGFEYKSSMVWDKVKYNMGYYSSIRHEFIIIAGKGKSTPTASGKIINSIDSVQSIPKSSRHSEKPDEFRKIIETLYPNTKKIQLFARKKYPGWDNWGQEI